MAKRKPFDPTKTLARCEKDLYRLEAELCNHVISANRAAAVTSLVNARLWIQAWRKSNG